MKIIKHKIIKYMCELCKTEYSIIEEAKKCEKSHFQFNINDKVIYHTGYSAIQHGGGRIWTQKDMQGFVLEVIIDKCLVEFGDGSRLWCKNCNLSNDKK